MSLNSIVSIGITATYIAISSPFFITILFYTSLLGNANIVCRKTRGLFATMSVAIWLPIMGVRLSLQQAKPLNKPSKNTIQFYLSTHQSFTDALAMAAIFTLNHKAIGPGIALYKAELGKPPVIGQLNRYSGNVPVGRSGDLEAAKKSLDQAGRRGREGYHVSGFPEGARRRSASTGCDQVGTLKKGFFYLASDLAQEGWNVELIPMVFVGSGRSWKSGNALPVWGSKVTVRFGDSVLVDTSTQVDELTVKFENKLRSELHASCATEYDVNEAFENGSELPLWKLFGFEVVVSTIPVVGVLLAMCRGLV